MERRLDFGKTVVRGGEEVWDLFLAHKLKMESPEIAANKAMPSNPALGQSSNAKEPWQTSVLKGEDH